MWSEVGFVVGVLVVGRAVLNGRGVSARVPRLLAAHWGWNHIYITLWVERCTWAPGIPFCRTRVGVLLCLLGTRHRWHTAAFKHTGYRCLGHISKDDDVVWISFSVERWVLSLLFIHAQCAFSWSRSAELIYSPAVLFVLERVRREKRGLRFGIQR